MRGEEEETNTGLRADRSAGSGNANTGWRSDEGRRERDTLKSKRECERRAREREDGGEGKRAGGER